MTPFEWVAIVGAAAWLPQIVGAVYRLLVKPRVVVVPVPQIEVGYNALGPILNVKATLFAQQKDAIVVEMDLVLRHERGKTLHLHWESFVEKFSDVMSSTGEKTEVSRDQEATALKLTTILPTEKFIRFRDPDFQERSRSLTSTADSELNRIKAAVAEPASVFMAGKPYSELASFYRHSFPWEPGVYDLELRIQLLQRKSPSLARSEFRLTEGDVELLQKNAEALVARIEQIARGAPEEERSPAVNWALPRLQSKQIMVKP